MVPTINEKIRIFCKSSYDGIVVMDDSNLYPYLIVTDNIKDNYNEGNFECYKQSIALNKIWISYKMDKHKIPLLTHLKNLVTFHAQLNAIKQMYINMNFLEGILRNSPINQ